jgi:histidine triad (HIT) family protein
MYLHEPENYSCIVCRIVEKAKNGENALTHLSSDVIWRSDTATAFLSLDKWKDNPVDVLVVPNEHFENIYMLPLRVVPEIHRLSRAVALALKTVYQCDGVSIRQNNEPAGNQDVWHYHVHVTPRFLNDGFYRSRPIPFPEEERLEHARRLCKHMEENYIELFAEKMS